MQITSINIDPLTHYDLGVMKYCTRLLEVLKELGVALDP